VSDIRPSSQRTPRSRADGYPPAAHADPDGSPASTLADQSAPAAAQVPASREWVGAVVGLMHSIDHAWQALSAHLGLSMNELIALEHLYFMGPVSSPALRRRTGLSASSVTALIDRLEQRELVRRVRPRTDRRVVLVELTDTGQDKAHGLFEPLVRQLELRIPSATTARLSPPLETVSDLIGFFEHIATSAAGLYPGPGAI
jgi:DNA-binding MarR family transcriptional regulator